MLRLVTRDSERSGAIACAPRESRLCLGGRSWHVTARSWADEERLLAGAVALRRVHADYYQRSMARARRKRACCASSRETSSAVARSRERHAKAGCVFQIAAGTSQHGLAPTVSGLSPVQLPFLMHGPTTTSAAWRARVASKRAAPRSEKQRVQWRDRVLATRQLAVPRRPQLARHSTVLRQ